MKSSAETRKKKKKQRTHNAAPWTATLSRVQAAALSFSTHRVGHPSGRGVTAISWRFRFKRDKRGAYLAYGGVHGLFLIELNLEFQRLRERKSKTHALSRVSTGRGAEHERPRTNEGKHTHAGSQWRTDNLTVIIQRIRFNKSLKKNTGLHMLSNYIRL